MFFRGMKWTPTTIAILVLVIMCGWCVGIRLGNCDFHNQGCFNIPLPIFGGRQ